MNKLTIIGRLTADPVLRVTTQGINVTTFTVAVDRRNTKEKATDFFKVTAWRGLADVCSKYLSKGRRVCVTGSVGIETYTTNNGENRANLTVLAEDVEFIESAQKTEGNAVSAPKTDIPPQYVEVTDEKLPWEC